MAKHTSEMNNSNNFKQPEALHMTDEERLHMITEQLILVRDNLFRGMSKSIQKLQARSINEVLELDNFTQSPQGRPLTDEEIRNASLKAGMQEHYMDFHSGFIRFARAIEAAHGIKENP